MRSVRLLICACHVTARACQCHNRYCYFWVRRIRDSNILVKIKGCAIWFYAICNNLCNCPFYLCILTVCINCSVSIIPLRLTFIACGFNLFACTILMYPLDKIISFYTLKVIIPYFYYLFKSTLCAMLISLPKNFVNRYVISCRNNVIFVISSLGK